MDTVCLTHVQSPAGLYTKGFVARRLMKITATKNGLRLSEHGIVISELRTTSGPTHSVFDVLAALIAVLRPTGRIGVLGFAGGGMMAPSHALGMSTVIHSVDLDRTGFDLFRRHCPAWTSYVNWQQAEAADWLRGQTGKFDLLMDDLSVPENGDVVKPSISWTVLPELIRRRLKPKGIAILNLLPGVETRWFRDLERVSRGFGAARLVEFTDFENRILIAGSRLPAARELGQLLRRRLRHIRSRQAERIRLRRFEPKAQGRNK